MLTTAAQLTVVRCRTCRHAYVSTVRDVYGLCYPPCTGVLFLPEDEPYTAVLVAALLLGEWEAVLDLLRTPEGKRWGWALAWGGRTDGA